MVVKVASSRGSEMEDDAMVGLRGNFYTAEWICVIQSYVDGDWSEAADYSLSPRFLVIRK